MRPSGPVQPQPITAELGGLPRLRACRAPGPRTPRVSRRSRSPASVSPASRSMRARRRPAPSAALRHVRSRPQRLCRASAGPEPADPVRAPSPRLASSTAAAPSVIGVELPAVSVPVPSIGNAGSSRASCSSVVSRRRLLSDPQARELDDQIVEETSVVRLQRRAGGSRARAGPAPRAVIRHVRAISSQLCPIESPVRGSTTAGTSGFRSRGTDARATAQTRDRSCDRAHCAATPCAVLVDADRRIARRVDAGRDAAVDLAQRRSSGRSRSRSRDSCRMRAAGRSPAYARSRRRAEHTHSRVRL